MTAPMTDAELAAYLADREAEIAGLTYAHQALSQAADETFARLRTKRDQLQALREHLATVGRLIQ